jgi:uncharacterized membrane protein
VTGDATARRAEPHQIEVAITRLLMAGTYLGVALLAVGVVLLLASGRSPLEGGPAFDPARLPFADLPRPEGFLGLGLMVIIATPAARVAASLVGYALNGEWRMVAVSAAILFVIAASIGLGLGVEG